MKPSRFSSIARSGYAPSQSTSQPLFYILANFAETQCVDPVTREMHSKQTPLSCQHKNHFCTNIQANPPPKANFRGISTLPQPYPHTATAITHLPARPHRRSMSNTPALLDQSSHGTQQGHTPNPRKLTTQSFAPSYRCAGYHFVSWRNMLDFKSPTSYISSHNEMKRTSTSTIPTEYLCLATFPLFGRLATKIACEYSWPCACGPCVFAR